jgi:hypothetical protein
VVRTQAELDQALRQGWTPRCVGDGEFRIGGRAQVWAFDSVGITASGHAMVRACDHSRVDAGDEATVWALEHAQVAGDGETMVFAFDDAQVLLRGRSLGEAYGRSVFEIYAGSAVRAHDHSAVEAFESSRVIALDDATVLALGGVGVLATDRSQVTAGDQSHVRICGGDSSVTVLEEGGTPRHDGRAEAGPDGTALAGRLGEQEKAGAPGDGGGGVAIHRDTPAERQHLRCGGCGGVASDGLCRSCRGPATARPDPALARAAPLAHVGIEHPDGAPGGGMGR